MKTIQTIVLVLVFLVTAFQQTDTNSGNRNKKVCQKALNKCGEFTIKPDVGEYKCDAIKCAYSCKLICPKYFEVEGRKKIMYTCTGGKWVPKPGHEAFCKATGNVKTVHHKLKNLKGLAGLINELFSSSYSYLAMSTFYGRADVSLPGFEKLMTDQWSSDQGHAREVMKYLNKRGAPITLTDIKRSPNQDKLLYDFFTSSSTYSKNMQNSTSRPGQHGIKMAIDTNKYILDTVHNLIMKTDPNTKHFLEHGLLSKKVKVIKKLADLHTNLRLFPDEDYSLGEYMLDQEMA